MKKLLCCMFRVFVVSILREFLKVQVSCIYIVKTVKVARLTFAPESDRFTDFLL